MRIFPVIICLLAVAVCTLGQTSKRYPHEMRGYQLWAKYNLDTLNPGVSSKSDIEAVLGAAMNKCEAPYDNRLTGCKLNEDWDVEYTQIDSDLGKLNTVTFYPRHEIRFSRSMLPGGFTLGYRKILDTIKATRFIEYSDSFGLKYVVVNESGDPKYKKGDLFYIE